MSAKFLGRNGGTTANAIKAVDYFTGLKQRGVNIVATNRRVPLPSLCTSTEPNSRANPGICATSTRRGSLVPP